MKKGIHPEYKPTTIVCSCGNEIQTRSTQDEIHVEICAVCHPFYTGRQKLVDTAGRVERFNRKYGDVSSGAGEGEEESAEGEAEAPGPAGAAASPAEEPATDEAGEAEEPRAPQAVAAASPEADVATGEASDEEGETEAAGESAEDVED